jgi:hypothetical protein
MTIESVFHELDLAIEAQNKSQKNDSGLTLGKAEIILLGQMSLISNPEVQAKIHLFSTMDVDAIVKGEYWIKKKLEELLSKEGLVLDPHSEEVWIPKESSFTRIFESPRLLCVRIDPVYALLSKAIKAKEKKSDFNQTSFDPLRRPS